MFGPIKMVRRFIEGRTVPDLLTYGFVIRIIALSFSIWHDNYTQHIKYTDIDFEVFTNGSKAILEGRSPYEDEQYRYPPVVALFFAPSILLNVHVGKVALIVSDIIAAHLLYLLSIYQGTRRVESKIYMSLWLFHPVTIAISTRGSFEPVLILVILSSIYFLTNDSHISAGLLYGLSIHLKLYPVIYCLPFYIYIVQRRPCLKTETKIVYWIKTLSPNSSHIKFFSTSLVSLVATSYMSFRYYGLDFLEATFLYHLRRKDLEHNFSVYFYLFNLFPESQDRISALAFLLQFIGVLGLSIAFANLETNRRTKLRKLSFNLFSTTFLFVSLNKVCTSQYFVWYSIFLPLILDSLQLDSKRGWYMMIAWLMAQAKWLLFAYLYEFQGYDVLPQVATSSVLFLMTNLWILFSLCHCFNPSAKKLVSESSDG